LKGEGSRVQRKPRKRKTTLISRSLNDSDSDMDAKAYFNHASLWFRIAIKVYFLPDKPVLWIPNLNIFYKPPVVIGAHTNTGSINRAELKAKDHGVKRNISGSCNFSMKRVQTKVGAFFDRAFR